jgi:27-O-demethylrifamycin SV methyltransferase
VLTAKSQTSEETKNPVAVYDRVTKAWELLLGDDLHFGYFENSQTPLGTATARLTREMMDWLRPRRETKVLDVGCGIGGPALFLAQTTGCHLTGISTSSVGVQTARKRAEALGFAERADFFERNGMANGFPDQSFDCIWIMESSHLMERKDNLLAESARVLRPKGLLVLCDIMVRNIIPFHYLVRNLAEFENLNTVFGKQNVELMETYKQLAKNNGLTVLRTADISEQVFPTMQRWRENADLYRGELQDLIGEEYRMQFIRACGFLERLWKEERLGYGMMLASKNT